MGDGVLHAVERPVQLRAELILPVPWSDVDERAEAESGRVVDEDVDASEGVDGGLDQLAARVPIGDVAVERHRLATLVDDLLRRALRIPAQCEELSGLGLIESGLLATERRCPER